MIEMTKCGAALIVLSKHGVYGVLWRYCAARADLRRVRPGEKHEEYEAWMKTGREKERNNTDEWIIKVPRLVMQKLGRQNRF